MPPLKYWAGCRKRGKTNPCADPRHSLGAVGNCGNRHVCFAGGETHIKRLVEPTCAINRIRAAPPPTLTCLDCTQRPMHSCRSPPPPQTTAPPPPLPARQQVRSRPNSALALCSHLGKYTAHAKRLQATPLPQHRARHQGSHGELGRPTQQRLP